jgi:hypothetical protein
MNTSSEIHYAFQSTIEAHRNMVNDFRLIHKISLSEEIFSNNFAFKKDNHRLPDVAINRIFDYASRIVVNQPSKSPDMWDNISAPHKEYINVLLDRNVSEFNRITQTICETPLVVGFMNYTHHSGLVSDINLRYIEALHFIDKLISLAEFLKISKVFNPEQGGIEISINNINDKNTLEFFLNQIFSYKSKVIDPPSAGGGSYGYRLDDKLFCMKDLKSFYSALRIENICRKNSLTTVNEIGGGLGFTAYYSNQLGIKDYSIFDLPSVSLIQAFFLMRSLGHENILLEGEPINYSKESIIRLSPYWAIFNSNPQNTLWFNHDSLPEISEDLAIRYIDHISLSNSSLFLSINQEAMDKNSAGLQLRVPDIVSNKSTFDILYRSRDFLRLGWIEELYQLN